MSLRSQIEVNVNNIKYLTSPTVNHARSQLYKNSVLRQNNSILANSMSKSFPAFPKQSPNFIHPFGKYTIQYLNMTQQTMFFSEKKTKSKHIYKNATVHAFFSVSITSQSKQVFGPVNKLHCRIVYKYNIYELTLLQAHKLS